MRRGRGRRRRSPPSNLRRRSCPPGIYFKRGAVAAYVIDRLHDRPAFGRVHFEKHLYLAEALVGVELHGHYKRDAAGPLDAEYLYKLENLAKNKGWFTKHQRGAEGCFYRLGPRAADRITAAAAILGENKAEMDRLLATTGRMTTEQVEIFATLFAAWNDRLIAGGPLSDDLVIEDVRERWHASKRRFGPDQLRAALDWMRKKGFVPRGVGPKTSA